MAKKKYKVVGIRPVADTPPGGEFSAELSEAEEARLVGIGAIALVAAKKKAKPQEGAVEEAADT